MKKWIFLLFVAVLMLSANAGWADAAAKKAATAPAKKAATAPVPKLYLDGKALKTNTPPAIVNSSVVVPIRTVAENLGYKVGYDSKKKQVSVKQGTKVILMTLNNPKATVNGKTVTMTQPPILKSNTTLIPLRFVGETFGLQILWDNASKSVFLYTDATSTGSGNGGASGGSGGTSANPGTGGGDSGTGSGTDSGTGAVQDPGSGTGTQPGSNPADGGSVGVVDGQDGQAGSGDTGGSGNAGGNGGSTDPNGNGSSDPFVIPAHLHEIRYEQDAVVITYDGLAAPTTQVLSGPDRIVVDIPNADYAADFTAGNIPGAPVLDQILELPVTGHEALQKIRFSQYQNVPKIARIVLDLNQPYGFRIANDAATGTLRIQLVKSGPAKSQFTVVLDAGHGGSDPGAQSITGRWEKDFTLSMVKKVQAILANEPKINLVLTRQDDSYPTLDDRVNLANGLNADLFLSIHGNAYTSSTNGTETYYTRANSLDFARLLHKNAVAATGFKDNGVRTANYKVIKYTTMPAALLEVGYLTNASDEKQMYNDAFQYRVAAAVAASIKQYFHLS